MIGCIIQARMGSSRLPGKIFKKIDEKYTVLEYVISQLKHSKLINTIIVATTNSTKDDVINEFLTKMHFQCFRGNEDDVLDRYYKCAKKYSISTIVRITSDNPLTDHTIVDKVIRKFSTNEWDYVSNKLERTFPQGTEVEVFSFDVLEKAWKNAKKPSEREHVTPYFYTNPQIFRISNIRYEKNISNLRWTIDRMPDLEFVRTIVSRIKERPILMSHILEVLSKEPDLIKINKNHIIDESYIKSLKNDEYFKSHI